MVRFRYMVNKPPDWAVRRTDPVAACQLCGKHTMFGRNIRHKSTGRWQRKAHKTSRTFEPNLHKQRVEQNARWSA